MEERYSPGVSHSGQESVKTVQKDAARDIQQQRKIVCEAINARINGWEEILFKDNLKMTDRMPKILRKLTKS